MKFWLPFTVVGGAAAIASLSAVCTTEYIQSVLPSLSDIPSGITINSDSVTVVPYDNYSVTDATFWNDVVGGSRFLAHGGAVYAIKNGSEGADMTGGIVFSAATGYTDAGFPYWAMSHIVSPVQIQTIGYRPRSGMFETFLSATINACDSLHGELTASSPVTIYVPSNLTSMLGEAYYCADSSTSSLGLGFGKAKRQASSATRTKRRLYR
ncbi:Tannase 2 [Seiridium cupressi]